MTSFALSIACLLGLLIAGEAVLWRLFRRRIDPVTFPHERDRSQVGFFLIGRMRLTAALHALALGAWVVCSLLWLW